MSDAPEPRRAEPPTAFDTYQLVLLKRAPGAPTLDEEAEDRLQAEHLGHFASMAEADYLKIAGPLADQPDETLRGICLYQVDSVDEARRLAELDPAVRAGRFVVDVMTWYTERGALSFTYRAPDGDR